MSTLTSACPLGRSSTPGLDFRKREGTAADWLDLIRAEYLEIPRLNLTRRQVLRLWNLDENMGDALLCALVDGGFLKRTAAGGYVRADDGLES